MSCQYRVEVTREFEKEFKSLTKKNKRFSESILKAIDQIRRNPEIGKPLSGPLAGKRSKRVESVFRIIYKVDGERKTVILLTVKHRKTVYG